jgi:hypothetical protein
MFVKMFTGYDWRKIGSMGLLWYKHAESSCLTVVVWVTTQSKILGSHSDDYKYYCPLRRDAMLTGTLLLMSWSAPIFRVQSTSGNGGSMLL